ncbi:MAG: hypothetical protein J6S76_07765 [Clostridia bacterium]|nr:hypothetical protein [Clostridia bacterium]
MPKIVNRSPERHSESEREALARARTAKAILREQEAERKRQTELRQQRSSAFFRSTGYLCCMLYALLNLLQFAAYAVIIFPTKGQPFTEMVRGGISISGHAIFFAVALFCAALYSLIRFKREVRAPGTVKKFLSHSCVWFTVITASLIAVHGIYMDLLYNQYDVTTAGIFLGPSYLIVFAAFAFSLCLTAVNRVYRLALPSALRVLIHLACVVTLISVFFQGIAHGFASASDLLIFLMVFSVIYALLATLYFSIQGAVDREKNDEQEYESIYNIPTGKKQK